MAKRGRDGKIRLSSGNGRTALFLAPRKDGFELLDYEFDYIRIHEKCGGNYSVEGKSVHGYIDEYADLTPVGYYRVDTKENACQWPEKITDEITIMFPYKKHERDKSETLRKNPVVIKYSDSAIIYCGFYTTMNDVLRRILSGEPLEKEAEFSGMSLVNTKTKWKSTDCRVLDVYDLFGCEYSPWEFFTKELKNYEVSYPKEKVYQIFNIGTCPDGTLVRTIKIGQKLFATEVLKKDPCEVVKKPEPIPGWRLGKTNIMYKFRDTDVYIIGWEPAEKAYKKKAERIARSIGVDEAELSATVKNYNHRRYITVERTVPKLWFFLEKEKILTQIYKDIAAQVNGWVMMGVENFIDDLDDERILEIVPDDRIITKKDSLLADNCEAGTNDFVKRYFPGRAEITAKELKKLFKEKLLSGRKYEVYGRYVMYLFRYIVTCNLNMN